jgi:hypothetical protein
MTTTPLHSDFQIRPGVWFGEWLNQEISENAYMERRDPRRRRMARGQPVGELMGMRLRGTPPALIADAPIALAKRGRPATLQPAPGLAPAARPTR